MTPFALSILYSIAADCTTTCSGISHKVARRNLLQQLSVCLWTYNARMIPRSDDDFPSPQNCTLVSVVVVC